MAVDVYKNNSNDTTTVSADQSKCSDGWTFFENTCYYFGDAGLNFYEAMDACEGMGGELAIVSSREQNDFIKGVLKNDNATAAWFSYTYQKSGLRYIWDNYGLQRHDFKDWPNNEEPRHDVPSVRRFRDARCGAFSKQNDWAWGSFDCGDTTGMKYVCEKCPFEQICTSRACFRLSCKKEELLVAKRDCKALGGSLATIRSEEESNTIKDFLRQVSRKGWGQVDSDVWLAGSDKYSEGNWYWDINGQKEGISDGFTDWGNGEPNNVDKRLFKGENCLTMKQSDDWKWNDIECWYDFFTLCEIPNAQDVNPVTG
ncbi:macrophage mannose receptor 1 [Plakobranchus ocellatus]|uniref:Macrophage mannose receptor 1 n=1 Tax=Plakobranchus ocellatus TaxID=259542 RepID=A0AAV3ZSH5_9GAST|nr:macrophage mannose receptor 1 [Plakobranchus ocellatus]